MLEPSLTDFREENCKILMELMRYMGRDINVLDLYEAYTTIYKKHAISADLEERNEGSQENLESRKRLVLKEDEVKEMFVNSLKELKYLGYIS